MLTQCDPRHTAKQGGASIGEHHEVVAVDDLMRRHRRELTRAAPGDRPQALGRVADQALGERAAVVADHLDGLVGLERAVDLEHTGG